MRLGLLTNTISSEFQMQKLFKQWLHEKELKYVDEMHIPEVNRRPDFLIIKEEKILINVEAKCINLGCLMEQLNDNARYCSYSFAFIPDYTLTPVWFKAELIKKGYGIIVWNYRKNVITEAFEAHLNKGINNELKGKIISRINERLIDQLTIDYDNPTHKQ
jgi:hypothetical protein